MPRGVIVINDTDPYIEEFLSLFDLLDEWFGRQRAVASAVRETVNRKTKLPCECVSLFCRQSVPQTHCLGFVRR